MMSVVDNWTQGLRATAHHKTTVKQLDVGGTAGMLLYCPHIQGCYAARQQQYCKVFSPTAL